MDVSEAVDRWVADSKRRAVENGFAQVDLDDLMDEKPPAAALAGLACLERIVGVLPRSEFDAVLTLPLDPGPCERQPPSFDDLLSLHWSYEPGRPVPGVYVVHAMQWRLPEQVEEYKRPLESPMLSAQFVAYYRAWRSVGESEFDRCIYVRSVPI